LQKRVTYFVMGADEWRHADSLEAATVGEQCLYLDAKHTPDNLYHSGVLGCAIGCGPPDVYRYNPCSEGPEVEAERIRSGGAITDQALEHALAGQALFYHSAPFSEAVEIVGFFRLEAWLSLSTPDTDIYVSIFDIDPNGNSVRLSTDAMRARYRQDPRSPALVTPGECLCYRFDHFTFAARRIEAGHRLRLVIGPIGRLVETTFAQKNYNTGGIVADETATGAKEVLVTLTHDREHPSALFVPIGAPINTH
jgi:putative CocE/NonD family hydrolase